MEAAKSFTGNNSESEAIALFKEELNASSNFFNSESFPANESDKMAHHLCSNAKAAKKYCPKRWAALQEWFKEARMVRRSIRCRPFVRYPSSRLAKLKKSNKLVVTEF